MKRVVGWVMALTLALTSVSACSLPEPSPSSEATGLGNGWQPSRTLELSYATQFSVDFYTDGQRSCDDSVEPETCEAAEIALITIADGSRFLVVPEHQKPPDGISADIFVLQQPLTNLYVAATAMMSLFVALDSLPSVQFVSIAAGRWHVPEVQAAMESGQLLFGGRYSAPDYELLLRSTPSLAIENTMIYHSPDVKEKLESVGIPVLVEQSSYEPHPLGRTEWIKLIGVLLDEEALASELFDAQATQLEALSDRVDTGKTVVYFYISSTGYVVTRKSGDYVPKMIQLAGGSYVFENLGDETATSSVNLEMEQFYAVAKDADYIIYNSTIGGTLNSLDDLIALNPLLQDFRAVQEGNVWCTNQDFYQDMTGLGQMITDMHQMLTDPTAPDHLTYLHRLR